MQENKKKNKKILFLTNNLKCGGAERVLVNLANKLSEREYDITVRLLENTGIYRDYLSNKVNYEYIFRKSFKGENYLYLLPHKWIYKKIAYGDFDIVVPYLQGVLTKIVSYGPKEQKKIAWLHSNKKDSRFIKSFRNKKNIRKCFSSYNRIVAVSEDVKKAFINDSGIYEKEIVVKYNTFNIDEIREMSRENICKGIKNGCINICSVGKLEEVKGYGRLLIVFKRLLGENEKLHLTIVGEGSERDKLEDYISRNNLNENIELIGLDSNPYKYISKSDLFICSSYSEGFSSVVAESIILGVPVVATDCNGMREILGNSEYGIVTENSEEGLYKGLKELLSELDYWKEKVKERQNMFSIESTVNEIENLFNGI